MNGWAIIEKMPIDGDVWLVASKDSEVVKVTCGPADEYPDYTEIEVILEISE